MKKLLMGLLAVIGLGTGSCAQNEGITTVSADDFEQAIQTDSVQLIDVRTAAEYAGGRIAYAQNIDVQRPDFTTQVNERYDKEKPVYVYCRSGHRSMMAARRLAATGFKVVNLRGGIQTWAGSGKPLSR